MNVIHNRIFQVLASLGLVAILFTSCKKDAGFEHQYGKPMSITDFITKQGGGGTEILITGTNFSTDTSEIEVLINGNKLAIIGANGRQIMAVVPKKCGSGGVVVRIGTDSAVSAEQFTYIFTRTVSTLAGGGTAGFANGKGADALFNFSGEAWYRSMGIAVDDNLNLFVADPGNHCIRKIDQDGNVTTFAGNPNNGGYADGQGTAAQFSLPYDIALDSDGNLYVVDPGNFDIRKITPDGNAVTIAWGQQSPWTVAVDPTSNMVYYTGNDLPGAVYRIEEPMTSVMAITGIKNPGGICFDQQGNLFVAVNGEHVIRKFVAGSWENTIVAGAPDAAGYQNGAAANARFAFPWGLELDLNGNIYVAGNGTWDGGSYNPDQSIRFISSDNYAVSTLAGSGTAGFADAIGEAASFSAPGGVAIDKNGTVYVLDKRNNRIRKIVSE
jgi:sugar lactone lactonase YvrE